MVDRASCPRMKWQVRPRAALPVTIANANRPRQTRPACPLQTPEHSMPHTRCVRAPKRARPMRREVSQTPPPDVNLSALASRTSYVGSPEHKSFPSFAGPPRLRADASKCDPNLKDPEQITEWLRAAITAGNFSSLWEGDFPRYVWHREGGLVYEGRLVNRQLGQYKGYPLRQDEWPRGING